MKHLINAPFQMNKTPKQRHFSFFFFSTQKKKISGWIEAIGLRGSGYLHEKSEILKI